MTTPVQAPEHAPADSDDPKGLLRDYPLLDLAAALEAAPLYALGDAAFERTLKDAALALRVAAAMALTQNECRLSAPYKPMQRIRDAKGDRWVCSHVPPHESPA